VQLTLSPCLVPWMAVPRLALDEQWVMWVMNSAMNTAVEASRDGRIRAHMSFCPKTAMTEFVNGER